MDTEWPRLAVVSGELMAVNGSLSTPVMVPTGQRSWHFQRQGFAMEHAQIGRTFFTSEDSSKDAAPLTQLNPARIRRTHKRSPCADGVDQKVQLVGIALTGVAVRS